MKRWQGDTLRVAVDCNGLRPVTRVIAGLLVAPVLALGACSDDAGSGADQHATAQDMSAADSTTTDIESDTTLDDAAAPTGDAALADGDATLALLTVTTVTPGQGTARGGDTVTITGDGFTKHTTVRFGETAAATVQIVSETQLQVVTPPMIAGLVDVTVAATGAEPDTLVDGFEVLPLVLRFVDVPSYAFPGMPELDVRALTTADVDMDGDPDLLFAVEGAAPVVLLNDGNGNFTDASPPEPDEPDEPDGDATTGGADAADAGSPDAGSVDAGASDDADTTDAGPTEEPPPPPTEVNDAWAGDLTGDGCPDLVLATGLGARLFAGDCTGLLEDVTATMLPDDPGNFGAVAAADLDGNERTDLVLTDLSSEPGEAHQTRLYLNTSDGAPLTRAPNGWAPQHAEATVAIALLDADGNGELDLVLGNLNAEDGVTLRLLLRHQGLFLDAEAGMLTSPAAPVTGLAVVDVDGDGDPDLVALCPGAQDRLYLNDGHGFFFDDTAISMPVDKSSGTRVATGDLDLDGDPDLLIANDPQQDRLYLNDGGHMLDYTPLLPIEQNPTRGALILDVDKDGDLDLVFGEGPGVPNRLLLSVKPEVP